MKQWYALYVVLYSYGVFHAIIISSGEKTTRRLILTNSMLVIHFVGQQWKVK